MMIKCLIFILIIVNYVHLSSQGKPKNDDDDDENEEYDYYSYSDPENHVDPDSNSEYYSDVEVEHKGKTTNGQSVLADEFPFLISIWVLADGTVNLLCDGVLIGPDLVITAAHCIFSPEVKHELDNMLVVFNVNNRVGPEDFLNVHMYARVIELYKHPKAEMETVADNLAILKLAKKFKDIVKGSKGEDKVKLTKIHPITGSQTLRGEIKVAGYEDPDFDDESGIRFLKRIFFDTLPAIKCSSYFPDDFIPSHTICATKSKKHEDTIAYLCETDDGGPVLLNKNGEWQLIGIMSNSYKCDSSLSWEIFTLIDYHWVTNVIRKKVRPTIKATKVSDPGPSSDHSNSKRSGSKRPELKKPELKQPELKQPEMKTPKSKRPELKRPKSKRPESKRPETKRPKQPSPSSNKAKNPEIITKTTDSISKFTWAAPVSEDPCK